MLPVLSDAKKALRETFVEQPKAWVATAKNRVNNLPQTNFELGQRFEREGKLTDALFRFRITEKFQPNYPLLSFHIGSCYFRMGRAAEAKSALLKAIKQHPNNHAAIFMLASIDPAALPAGMRPTVMPKEMVTGFFSSVAPGYDIEEAKNNYQAGKIIHALVSPHVQMPNPVIVDLGCGSGIAARPWRLAASSITGVDITPDMLSLARNATHADKKLYDQLVEADMAQLPMSVASDSADVVLLVNATQFAGDLIGAMQGVARVLKRGGAAVVTVEPFTANTGYGLSPATSRFGHSAEYVAQLGASNGLNMLKQETLELYEGIPAQAVVFTKG